MLENVVTLNGVLKVNLSLVCSRCSEIFENYFEIEITEEFNVNSGVLENSNYDDFMLPDGENIDIKSIIENNILFELPMKILCNVDCKGLCQECGANLNCNSCNCKNEEIDPRLYKLKDFFK